MSLGSFGNRRATRLLLWLAVGPLALGLLASCGGSTTIERYIPSRVLAFGDENSVIEADGSKYTVNAVKTDLVTLDCAVHPLWVQVVAGHYGLVFPQCPGTVVAPASRIYAVKDARVAGLAAQIALAGAMSASDLATVFVGSNDIIDLYKQFPGKDETTLRAEAQALAVALAQQIRSIVDKGGKVAFSTLPDLGGSPFALAEEAKAAGRASLLSNLTTSFNSKLRTSISNPGVGTFVDGHQGVQVLGDEMILAIRKTVDTVPSVATYINYTVAICDIPTLAATVHECTTQTLLAAATAAGGTATNYLWSDDRHLGAGGQASLGVLAVTRINANPL